MGGRFVVVWKDRVEISNLVLLFYEMEIEKIEMLKPPIEKFHTRKI